jgi:hypothetical protein
MTTPWQEYRKKLSATPFGLVDKESYTSEEEAKARLDMCNGCDRFINLTKQCKECGCFMPLKTKLKNTKCPLNKW